MGERQVVEILDKVEESLRVFQIRINTLEQALEEFVEDSNPEIATYRKRFKNIIGTGE